MKIKGVIPELKMSIKNTKPIEGLFKDLKSYKVLSVNTNSLFDGELRLLKVVREYFPKKFLIRKDFIMIPRQIKESKEAGADAVLILRDLITKEQYRVLIRACEKEQIIPITEIHGITTIHDRPFWIKEPILVNSRNLNTGKFNKKQAEDICRVYKENDKNVIYASGENSDRIIRQKKADAVLIGTAFMQGKLKIPG